MFKHGTFSKEGKSDRLFSVSTLERCAFFIGGGYERYGKNNLGIACQSCNKKKYTKTVEEFLASTKGR